MTKITYHPIISVNGTDWEITIDGDNINSNDIKILSESVMESHSKERIAYWDNEKIKSEKYKYEYKYKITRNIILLFLFICIFLSYQFLLNKNEFNEGIKNLQNQLANIQTDCSNNYKRLELLLINKTKNQK